MTPFLFSSFPVIVCAAERATRSIAAMALLAETTVLLPCDGAHDLPSPVITTTAREGRRRSGDVIDVGASSFSSSSSSSSSLSPSPHSLPLPPPLVLPFPTLPSFRLSSSVRKYLQSLAFPYATFLVLVRFLYARL